jgi:PAS domain S-box-containing protein
MRQSTIGESGEAAAVRNSSLDNMNRPIFGGAGAALFLTLLAWALSAAQVSPVIVSVLNLLSALVIVGLATYILSLSLLSRSLMFGLSAAVGIYLAFQILHTTGSIEALNSVPVFGSEGLAHEIVRKALKMLAVAIMAITGLLAVVESIHDKRVLSQRNEELLAEIEDRKQSNIARRNLGAIIRSSNDAILSTDLSGHLLTWNHGAENLFGYTAEEVMGRDAVFLAAEPDKDRHSRFIERFLKGEHGEQYRTARRCKDGSLIHVSIKVSPVQDSDGEVVGMSAIMRDISPEVRAEESLRKSEEKMRHVFESIPIIIATLNRDGKILSCNRGVTGAVGSDLAGLSVYQFIPGHEHSHIREIIDRVVADGEPESTEIEGSNGMGADGVYFCRVGRIQLEDGEPGLIVVSEEVTRKFKFERALRALVEGTARATGAEFFRLLARHLAEALDVQIAFVAELASDAPNSATTHAMWTGDGYAENITYALEGTPCEEIISSQFCAFKEHVQDLFPRDSDLAKLGAESYIGCSMVDASGKTLGLLGVMDVNPMDQLEYAESILKVFALRAVAELERLRGDEERSHLEAQMLHTQKLESLGVLAGGIAHDFNNLLAVMLGYSSLCRDDAESGSDLEMRLGEIEKAAHRAGELTKLMLAYSGRAPFSVQPVQPADLLTELGQLLDVSMSKKATLVLDIENGDATVLGDVSQLQQVFLNLIINASEALEESSGTITVSTWTQWFNQSELDSSFTTEPLPEGEYVCIKVADTGCGMDEDTRAKIFDPFFSTKFTGRGLGLAAVLGIVHGHGGTIAVESEPGKGTAFRVTLPTTAKLSNVIEQQTASPPPNSAPDNGTTILIVDDEEIVLAMAKTMLELVGHSILTARNGEEAVAIYREQGASVDLIILDLTMPVMDGVEAFKRIMDIDPKARVLLSSGYAAAEAMAQFEELNLSGFIQKPYGAEDLVKKVADALDGKLKPSTSG